MGSAQPQSARWKLRTEIQACLGIIQELWAALARTADHNYAVAAWNLVLDGEGIAEGELLNAVKIWAKSVDGKFPPRPANLLEIVKRERVLRVRRAELQAWRAAGSPTIDAEGTVHFADEDRPEVSGSAPAGDVIRIDSVAKRLPHD